MGRCKVVAMRTNLMNVLDWLGTRLYSLAVMLLVALPAMVSVSHTEARSTAVLPPLAPVAAVSDAEEEGTDVLMVDWAASPWDLWNALVPHTEWYDDASTGGHGTFYAPVGTELLGTTGAFVATHDGWLHYPFNVELGGRSEPVQLHVPAVPADHGDACAVAAGLLLDALNTGTWIEEDLSYTGMSPVEAWCNDQLADEFYAPGRDFDPLLGHSTELRTFLEERHSPAVQIVAHTTTD